MSKTEINQIIEHKREICEFFFHNLCHQHIFMDNIKNYLTPEKEITKIDVFFCMINWHNPHFDYSMNDNQLLQCVIDMKRTDIIQILFSQTNFRPDVNMTGYINHALKNSCVIAMIIIEELEKKNHILPKNNDFENWLTLFEQILETCGLMWNADNHERVL